MSLREEFTANLKTAMLAKDAAKTSTIRMIIAKMKEADIAARPKGIDAVPDVELLAMLRSMVKSRRESVDMYTQGNRQDLADKEQAEIAVIETFLPPELDGAALQKAVTDAVAEAGATTQKDMGQVMAVLKTRHGAALDMAKVGPLVKAALG